MFKRVLLILTIILICALPCTALAEDEWKTYETHHHISVQLPANFHAVTRSTKFTDVELSLEGFQQFQQLVNDEDGYLLISVVEQPGRQVPQFLAVDTFQNKRITSIGSSAHMKTENVQAFFDAFVVPKDKEHTKFSNITTSVQQLGGKQFYYMALQMDTDGETEYNHNYYIIYNDMMYHIRLSSDAPIDSALSDGFPKIAERIQFPADQYADSNRDAVYEKALSDQQKQVAREAAQEPTPQQYAEAQEALAKPLNRSMGQLIGIAAAVIFIAVFFYQVRKDRLPRLSRFDEVEQAETTDAEG